jgi:hypothetical protein
LEKNELLGHLFWQRRDSENSKVRFKNEVEVLEYERDPDEDSNSLSRGEYNHIFGERRQANPIIVLSTCICAIAVTILLPWFMITSNEPVE